MLKRTVSASAPRLPSRRQAEAIIEHLIEILDDLDGDVDIEDHPDADSDTEPSLGWFAYDRGMGYGGTDDLEGDFSDYEPEENEASWVDAHETVVT